VVREQELSGYPDSKEPPGADPSGFFLVRRPGASGNQVGTPEGRERVEFVSGELLGMVPGMILVIVAMGLMVEAIDERKVLVQVRESLPREPAGTEVLRPLAEAA
jgi:hypothetical protein